MSKKIYLQSAFAYREDTLANWLFYNPILEKGEVSIVRDGADGEWLKIGDGVTRWVNLPYKKGPRGDAGPIGPQGPAGDDYVLTETDKEEIANMAKPEIDQTYSPESENPQSGIAVAEAIDKGNLKLIKKVVTEEPITRFIVNFDKPLKELWVRFIGALDIEANVTDCILAARCDEGAQYLVYSDSNTFEPETKKAFTFHAKEIVTRNWETEFGKKAVIGEEKEFGYKLQGLASQSADLKKSYSTRNEGNLPQYVSDLQFFVYSDKYPFAVGGTLEIWGVEVDE